MLRSRIPVDQKRFRPMSLLRARADAVVGADMVIPSVPLSGIPKCAVLLADLPAQTVFIDTSNYYPMRRRGKTAEAPKRCDQAVAVIAEYVGYRKTTPDADFSVALIRRMYAPYSQVPSD